MSLNNKGFYPQGSRLEAKQYRVLEISFFFSEYNTLAKQNSNDRCVILCELNFNQVS